MMIDQLKLISLSMLAAMLLATTGGCGLRGDLYIEEPPTTDEPKKSSKDEWKQKFGLSSDDEESEEEADDEGAASDSTSSTSDDNEMDTNLNEEEPDATAEPAAPSIPQTELPASGEGLDDVYR